MALSLSRRTVGFDTTVRPNGHVRSPPYGKRRCRTGSCDDEDEHMDSSGVGTPVTIQNPAKTSQMMFPKLRMS